MITVSYGIKNYFFDRQSVIGVVEKKKRGILSKAGAFIRRAARSSIRKIKTPGKVSSPGSPPYAHSSDTVRTIRNILFGYDPGPGSVVVGPVGLNVLNVLGGRLQPGAVPNVLEFGGTLSLPEIQARDGTWRTANFTSLRRAGGRPTRLRPARYRPRPFMAPALARELPKFPSLWKNSIVKAG